VICVDDLPVERPAGLRRRSIEGAWWRIDTEPPDRWSWTGYPTPRNRFDPADGRCRVRYAARTARGALRERFHDRGRYVGGAELAYRLVRVTGTLRVLDLRPERTLDLLGLDEEVSVGRSPRVFAASQALAARALSWYADAVHGLVYASRTTPRTSANLAFCPWAPVAAEDLGPLADHVDMLTVLVIDDGFTVDLPL